MMTRLTKMQSKIFVVLLLASIDSSKISHRAVILQRRLNAKAQTLALKGGHDIDRPSKEVLASSFTSTLVLQKRLQIFVDIQARRAAEAATHNGGGECIWVTLPDGKHVPAERLVTTPLDIARNLSRRIAGAAVAAKVNGEMWDLMRALDANCSLELVGFDDDEGRRVAWHSAAHVLGQALELRHGAELATGPATEEGFYYDARTPAPISAEDLSTLESLMADLAKGGQPFERLELTKEEALDMFADNEFKVDIIHRRVPDGGRCTAYRCGNLVDLCRGPHLPRTDMLKAFALTKTSSSYWRGNATGVALQRVNGVAFLDPKDLRVWRARLEEAKKRDHRDIGKRQGLFSFHPLSPGSAFFLPHGTRIYNRLLDYLRAQYRRRGYDEVITPNIFYMGLWERSGHAAHYRDNMFLLEAEKSTHAPPAPAAPASTGCHEATCDASTDCSKAAAAGSGGGGVMGLKPMNCPGHCLIYAGQSRSYRDLPLRLADFGALHRNEPVGALTGLTRVRRFQQDDAHIFCRADQVEAEVAGVLDFVREVYGVFGMDFELRLSTRPADAMGSKEEWCRAEQALTSALKTLGCPYKVSAGDGAFYGPKIDVVVFDALRRRHQCATIQLDFQLPIRFGLTYHAPAHNASTPGASSNSSSAPENASACAAPATSTTVANPAPTDSTLVGGGGGGDSGEAPRPVMIHRAVMGSLERFIAILTEHTAGKWPFWLSPRQCMVVPVGRDQQDYGREVRDSLRDEGFYADLDDSNNTLPKKIRESQLAQYNYILVVGREEVAKRTVNVRTRDNQVHGERSLQDLVGELRATAAAFH